MTGVVELCRVGGVVWDEFPVVASHFGMLQHATERVGLGFVAEDV